MIKLIIFILAAYAVYRLFFNEIKKKKTIKDNQEKMDAEKKIETGEMVQDPECGTYVLVEDSPKVRDGEKIYYFCSYECRNKFLNKLENGSRILAEREKD